MTKISVIIPTHNRQERVMRALQSVLKQTVIPEEIIVVDDGSTDATAKINWSDFPNVKYVKKDNGGASSARNVGARLATHPWIAFLDSDDTWLPEKIENQLKSLASSDAAICFTGAIDDNGNRKDGIAQLDGELAHGSFKTFERPADFIYSSENHPLIQSLLIKKEVYLSIGGMDETLCVAEDTDFFYKLVNSFNVILLNMPLVALTRHREVSGLSDSADASRALLRYHCYSLVQARAYDMLLAAELGSQEKAKGLYIARNRMAYFMSRKAEIACALGQIELCKNLARDARCRSSSMPVKIRCAILQLAPKMLRARLSKKWPKG